MSIGVKGWGEAGWEEEQQGGEEEGEQGDLQGGEDERAQGEEQQEQQGKKQQVPETIGKPHMSKCHPNFSIFCYILVNISLSIKILLHLGQNNLHLSKKHRKDCETALSGKERLYCM